MEYSIAEYINLSWLYWIIVAIYSLTILSTIIIILSENRNPVKSLAWVTVLILLPAVGLILYIFFGRSIKNTHMISRRNRRRLKRRNTTNSNSNINNLNLTSISLSPESIHQIKLTRNLNGSKFYSRNNIKIYPDGYSKFEDFKQDLIQAKEYINIQYYIIEDDNIGTEIKNILIAKASEGVKIRIIYDHVGSFSTKNSFFNEMKAAGIMVHPFFKVSFPFLGTRINWRNHRKLCCR